ncbi:MAG: hypothetical protein ABIH82_03405 [Candidatus Woesearchaeota archaeon]
MVGESDTDLRIRFTQELMSRFPKGTIFTTTLDDVMDVRLEDNSGVVVRLNIKQSCDNYVGSTREAERLNAKAGFELWIGCWCGSIHYEELGHNGSSWY